MREARSSNSAFSKCRASAACVQLKEPVSISAPSKTANLLCMIPWASAPRRVRIRKPASTSDCTSGVRVPCVG